MRRHEVDDAADPFRFELVTDVDQHDARDPIGMLVSKLDGRHPAERRAHDGHVLHAEPIEQRRHGGGDQARHREVAELGQRGVGVAVGRQVRRQDMRHTGESRPEVFVHVRRLAAAMKAQHGRQAAVSPLEVVHLPPVDRREAAPTTERHVVARYLGHGLVRSGAPSCGMGNWSLTTLPVVLRGSVSTNQTRRGTL